ncbi:MAG: hypothetical protein ABMA01_22945 [Chthoniobacteraceae bacterium]
MSSSGSSSGLIQALKDLTVHWEQTRAHWLDAKSGEFQQKYLENLPILVARTTTAFEEIDALITRIRTDCE